MFCFGATAGDAQGSLLALHSASFPSLLRKQYEYEILGDLPRVDRMHGPNALPAYRYLFRTGAIRIVGGEQFGKNTSSESPSRAILYSLSSIDTAVASLQSVSALLY